MEALTCRVPGQWAGTTVREFARRYLGYSARILTRLKQNPMGIGCNGLPAKTITVLQEGDLVSFLPGEEPMDYPAAALPFSLCYEDVHFLIGEKGPHMPVHPSPGHDGDSLLHGVTYHWQQAGESHCFRPLYRLDKDTSGLIVLAKHLLATSVTLLDKTYYAICQGILSGEGSIDAPIGLKSGSIIQREAGAGSPAVTKYRALVCHDNHTLVELQLETGRTHQIRVHLSSIGHPLAGDDLYGGGREIIHRQALHCAGITLQGILPHVNRRFTSAPPDDIKTAFPWIGSVLSE